MLLKKEFIFIILKFFSYFSTFFIVFFVLLNFTYIKEYFISDEEYFEDEDIFYSASEQDQIYAEVEQILQKQKIQKIKQEIISQKLIEENTNDMNLDFVDFEKTDSNKKILEVYEKFFELFFNYKVFSDKILDLNIALYKGTGEVRGKLYKKKIYLYEIFQNEKNEIFSVFIHEFGHFIDLYYFQKNILTDISDEFYKISWDDTVMLSGQNVSDFVTGYSMSNKYEDFAESFLFYVLYNKEFYNKTLYSDKIKEKYDFFTQYLFTEGEFINTSFSINNNFNQYIRDGTKLNYDLENLLNYLKK